VLKLFCKEKKLKTAEWKDYKIIATGNGEKLESWAGINLIRPDPQVIWKNKNLMDIAKERKVSVNARYFRSESGGGQWEILKKYPEEWTIKYNDLKFLIKPMGFKHTGLFPEQAVNWDRMAKLIKDAKREIKVLNLFAYTGGASIACAKVGASVTHVDASKGMTDRAKENAKINDISNIRFIVDDCKKFIEREIRRGNKYDAIIMDPPSYGRGPNGEMWKIEESLFDFVELSKNVLSEKPLFVLINSYTTGLQAGVIANILALVFGNGGIDSDEIGVKTEEGIVLPCGNSGFKIF